MSDSSNQNLNRRALLLGAVLLVGGGAALTRLARSPGLLAGKPGRAFNAEQFALLEQVCETIIPATDTPGAIAAGVPAFMRQILEEWGSEDSRAEIAGVLEAIEKLAWSRFGAAFPELNSERRLEVVSGLDAERLARHDPAYSKFKHLVLLGYYQSEIGATHELRYELVPGAWRANLPLSEVGRASAV